MLVLNRRRLRLAQANLLSENALRAEVEKRAGMLQRRLTRFSRERSVGAMVTTLAHEINQPLIAIQNYAQAAKRRLQDIVDDEPKIIELLAKIEGQAERAGGITQRVRALVNNSEAQMSPVSLNTLIEEVISILKPDCEAIGCRIDYHRPNVPVTVLADTLQMQLVLVNLLNNALHSLSAGGKTDGIISIDTEMLDERVVQVSVSDEGVGISPDRDQYIFDPLYSEKNTGMGMGLAICRDIVDLHGGRIWYEPNPAGGAIFRFTLRTRES
jgi:two-component system sensor kinase FixL